MNNIITYPITKLYVWGLIFAINKVGMKGKIECIRHF